MKKTVIGKRLGAFSVIIPAVVLVVFLTTTGWAEEKPGAPVPGNPTQGTQAAPQSPGSPPAANLPNASKPLETQQQQTGNASADAAGKETRFGIPKFFTTKPPLTPGIFPCSQCHATMTPNKQRRDLGFHLDVVLNHATKQRWCLDCHDANDRDKLKLANGDLIPFTESYFLCGQCHGNIFRDWKTGIHGKRIGFWNGEKQYYLCVNCHNQHSPKFQPLKPLPVPVRPHSSDVVKGTTSVEIEGKTIYIPVYK